MAGEKNQERKARFMTFSYDKIQSCKLFLNKKVLFHKAASVKSSDLYRCYRQYLQELGLESSIVEKHQLWGIINTVLPDEMKSSLRRKVSKQLYYIGLDLKDHGISEDAMEKLVSKGIGRELTEIIISNEMKIPVLPIPSKAEGISSPTTLDEGLHPLCEGTRSPSVENLQQVEEQWERTIPSQDLGVSDANHGRKLTASEVEPGSTVPVKRGRGRPRKEKGVVDVLTNTMSTYFVEN